MTIPNGPGMPGPPAAPPQPQPPYNPKPGLWSSVPRAVLAGGAAAMVAVVVVILVVTLRSGGDSGGANTAAGEAGTGVGTTTPAATFAPNLFDAQFGSGWRDTKTKEPVTPPQRIKITGSLDLTEKVESIGYGANEQSLPKLAKNATTASSFPHNPAINMFLDSDGALRLVWGCETFSRHPAAANCQDSYKLIVNITGSAPAVVGVSVNNTTSAQASTTALSVEVQNMAVSNPEELPASVRGTDKGTGAPTVLMLSAAQPRESYAKVYFVVADSLKLYVGELEPSR